MQKPSKRDKTRMNCEREKTEVRASDVSQAERSAGAVQVSGATSIDIVRLDRPVMVTGTGTSYDTTGAGP